MRANNTAGLDDGFLAITGLSRAVGGSVELPDVGSLLWVLLQRIAPCDAMAIFLPDPARDQVVVRHAAGAHAELLHGVTRPSGSGIAGWVAVNRRPVLNAEPIFDFGFRVSSSPALRSSVVVPLVDNGAVVAVLALYSTDLLAFTDEHVSMLEMLGPRMALALVDAVVVADEDPAIEERPRLRLVARAATDDARTFLSAPHADDADHEG